MSKPLDQPLQKLTASSNPSVRVMLWHRQKGLCPLCGKRIDLSVVGKGSDYAMDHCHETGEVRALLHRSCNSMEGKVKEAIGSWGSKSHKYEDVRRVARNLVQYWDECESGKRSTGMMYYLHKTPEQKKESDRIKRNKAAAVRRAKIKVKATNNV